MFQCCTDLYRNADQNDPKFSKADLNHYFWLHRLHDLIDSHWKEYGTSSPYPSIGIVQFKGAPQLLAVITSLKSLLLLVAQRHHAGENDVEETLQSTAQSSCRRITNAIIIARSQILSR